MKTQAVVPVEEYLATTYSPDKEYLDGVLLERNLGEKDHSRTQLVLGALFLAMERKLQIKAYSDHRVHVRPERYRVPDLCVVKQSQRQGQIFAAPPFLCVEILSKDDSLMSLQERILSLRPRTGSCVLPARTSRSSCWTSARTRTDHRRSSSVAIHHAALSSY